MLIKYLKLNNKNITRTHITKCEVRTELKCEEKRIKMPPTFYQRRFKGINRDIHCLRHCFN